MNNQNKVWTGIGLAVLATLIWSGNFIVARGEATKIPPVSLNFYRWLCASVLIAPFAIKKFQQEFDAVKKSIKFLAFSALFGISIFNSLVYIAGHYSSAINLALIGTTSSPIMSIILAKYFLKERIGTLRIIGLVICIVGILLLISGGSWDKLSHFRFTPGDWWILGAALCFAVYNTSVKRKPASISPVNFLFSTFIIGTIILLPFFFWELNISSAPQWDLNLVLSILYLGAGASVISFFCWNAAIARLGAGRASLFGNLIPIFSTVEAVLILNEKISSIQIISGLLVIGGLVLANLVLTKKS